MADLPVGGNATSSQNASTKRVSSRECLKAEEIKDHRARRSTKHSPSRLNTQQVIMTCSEDEVGYSCFSSGPLEAHTILSIGIKPPKWYDYQTERASSRLRDIPRVALLCHSI